MVKAKWELEEAVNAYIKSGKTVNIETLFQKNYPAV